MRRRLPMLLTALAGLVVGYLLNDRLVTAQQGSVAPVAAVPSQKGGQDIFGAYDAAVGWPKKLSSIPGHGPWTFGAGQSVFAESANRVFVLQRGELPEMPTPRGFWGVHGFSVDPDGNFYVAEVDNGGAHKFTPRAGANPAFMVGTPIRVAWK